MKPMKWVFASNYINHHQLPFCDAMYELLQGSFAFIQTMEMEEERQLLANILKALPERQRQIVILKYFEDMTSGQIADRLGMTESNVRVQLFRAMKKMQDMLTD